MLSAKIFSHSVACLCIVLIARFPRTKNFNFGDLPCLPRIIFSFYRLCFFLFFNGHTCSVWKFLGQGLNPSCSCDLCHRCSNTGSFHPLHWARDQTCTSVATGATETGFLKHWITVGTPMHIFIIKIL